MARKLVTFTGRNGTGVISVSGVLAGDKVISVMFTSVIAGEDLAAFGPFVITDGEIVQLEASDRTSFTFAALIERHVMLP